MKRAGYIALMIFGMFCFGCMGICTRKLTELGLDSPSIAFVRLGFSTLFLFLILLIFKRESLKFKKADIWILLICGLFKIMSDMFLFIAQTGGMLALASLLQLTEPYFVIIISLFLFKESITVKKIVAISLAVIGCIFATGVLFETKSIGSLVVIAGLTSGIFYASYTVTSKAVMDRGNTPETTLFYAFLFGTILTVPIAWDGILVVADLAVQLEPLMYMLALSLIMTLIPFFIINVSIIKLGTTSTAMLCLMEVVFSAIIGWVVFDEHLTPFNIIGMILVIMSITLINVQSYYRIKNKMIADGLDTVVIDGTMPSKYVDSFWKWITRKK